MEGGRDGLGRRVDLKGLDGGSECGGCRTLTLCLSF